jgi:hypothetical protein
MKQSPTWDSNVHLDSQEILRLLWNPKVSHRVYSPTTGPCPEPVNSLRKLMSYFFRIHFNIILPSTSRSSKPFITFRLVLTLSKKMLGR